MKADASGIDPGTGARDGKAANSRKVHPELGIALEVEAGRATMGNAIYRDLIQASLMVDARFLVLAVPIEYRYKNQGKITREPSYDKTYSVAEAIYGSTRMALPFEGLLLIGY